MTNLLRSLPFVALCLLPGCNKADDAKDKIKKLNTMNDCFPPTYEKADALFNIANSWRVNSGAIFDPLGLHAVDNGNGSLRIDYDVDNLGTCIFGCDLWFFDELGNVFVPTFTTESTLNEFVSTAATQLFDNDADPLDGVKPFMVGDWTVTGVSVNGGGSLTGIIGGTANQNELESVSTSEDSTTVAGGPPAHASCSVTLTGGATDCVLTFSTVDLETDTPRSLNYPFGVISGTLVGPEATVVFTITLNGTATAVIKVGGISGSFDFNLDTGDLNYNP
jgi:hypothetical protein